MSEREPVTMMEATTQLDYVFTAGVAQSKNLHGLEQGKFIGQRCPKCKKVYTLVARLVPDRRRAHRRDRRAAQHGHGDDLLRGQRALRRPVDRDPLHLRADPPRRGEPLVHGAHPGDPDRRDPHGHAGRGGLGRRPRSSARPWPRSSTSAPTASPTPTTRPTRSTCERVPRARLGPPPGRRGVLRPVRQRAPGGRPQRGRDAHAGGRRGVRQHRHHQGRRRLHLLGLDRLPRRRPLLLRDRARRRRRVAAPGRVPRRDGRRLGPLRGLGAAAGGRDRRRARLLLRALLAGRPERDPGRAARPVLHGAAVARPDVAGRPAGAGDDRQGHGHRGRLRRRRQPLPPLRRSPTPRPRWPTTARPRSCWPRTTRWPRCAGTHCRRSPTAAPRSCWPPATGPTSCASGRPSSPASTTGSRPTRSAPATSPSRPRRSWRGRRPGWAPRRSTWPSCTRPSPTRR